MLDCFQGGLVVDVAWLFTPRQGRYSLALTDLGGLELRLPDVIGGHFSMGSGTTKQDPRVPSTSNCRHNCLLLARVSSLVRQALERLRRNIKAFTTAPVDCHYLTLSPLLKEDHLSSE